MLSVPFQPYTVQHDYMSSVITALQASQHGEIATTQDQRSTRKTVSNSTTSVIAMWCSITRVSDWNGKDFVPSLQCAGLADKRKE